jgi:hypothetical protein
MNSFKLERLSNASEWEWPALAFGESASGDRVAGEIALKSPDQDIAEAEAYFARALIEARSSQDFARAI